MKKLLFTLILFLSLTTGLFAIPTTWTVRATGGNFTTLNDALSNVSVVNGDTIDMLGDFTTDVTITIGKSVTIRGNGPTNTSLTRVGTTTVKRLFNVNASGGDVAIKNMTLIQASFTGTDVGMALQATNALTSITLDNLVIKNFNSGTQSAGAIYLNNAKNSRITNCEFINNTNTSTGGAIQIGGGAGSGSYKTRIENCTFELNNASAANSGHAIMANYATASADSIIINNCTFYKNGATTNVGSSIRLAYNGAKIVVSNCTFANNNALSTAGDIFTNSAANTIAAALTVHGNLFYKSGGLIINASWTGDTRYNLSTGTMTLGTLMTKTANTASLAADASGGIQLEYDNITGNAILANNGGYVRTIKLLGSTSTDNKAINLIPLSAKMNSKDARGYDRNPNSNDCGAYEHPKSITVTGGTNSSTLATNGNTIIAVNTGKRLVIDNDVTISAINVTAGGRIQINSGKTLTGTLNLLNSTDGSTGTLVDFYTTATKQISMKQYVASSRNWYISTPISVASYSLLNKGVGVIEFDEATKQWLDVTSGNLQVGKGYIQKASATQTGTTGDISFDGLANSGPVTVVLSRTGTTQAGFNLVGNPYPSYLDWTKVAAANTNVAPTAWYRTKTAGGAYTFATVNVEAKLLNPLDPAIIVNGSASSEITTYIPPMQAYWVRLLAAQPTNNFTVTNSMRDHRDSTLNVFKAPRQGGMPLVRLQIANETNADEAVLYFNSSASDDFDRFDSPKMFNNIASQPEIYTIAGTEKVVINGMNQITNNLELKIGFNAGQPGTYILKSTELNNIDTNNSIYLRDKVENTETELYPQAEYSFNTSNTGNNESRFSLIFKSKSLTTSISGAYSQKSTVFVNAQKDICIYGKEGVTFSIFNAIGTKVAEGKINASPYILKNQFQGMYIIKTSNNFSAKILL
jgi:hypothetical protein